MKVRGPKFRSPLMRRMFDFASRIDLPTLLIHLVLITAGAVLALFLSNLHERSIEKRKELVMLEQLQQALNLDLQNLQSLIATRQVTLTEARSLREFLEQDNPWNDSISSLFYNISSSEVFFAHTGAFESLKSIGTNIIDNSGIRFGLFTVYEENFRGLNRLEEAYISYLNTFWVPYLLDKIRIDSVPSNARPLDFDALKNDYRLKSLVTVFIFNNNALLNGTRQCVMDVQMLTNQIQFEMDRIRDGRRDDLTPRKFTMRLKGHADAKVITVSGSFNKWSYIADTMKRTADGWMIDLHLTPGWYMYKFRVDSTWLEDTTATQKIINEYGTYNSLIKVE